MGIVNRAQISMKPILIWCFLASLAAVTYAQDSHPDPRHVGGELWLVGSVSDRASQPLAGLTVELWQGDEQGRYRHPGNDNPEELHESFQYFGTATTDADGNFVFRTLTPGGGAGQPATLQLRVRRQGEILLTTAWQFPETYAASAANQNRRPGWDDTSVLLLQDISPHCASGRAFGILRIVLAQIVLDQGEGGLLPTAPPSKGEFHPGEAIRGSDNDLLDPRLDQGALTITDVPEIALGRVGDDIWVIGTVYDRDAQPLGGYEIQLWQADDHGRHHHPDDDSPYALREDFQYFGTAHSDASGALVFRTLKPYPYRQRPAHLHFFVKREGEMILTSQFFFPEDHAFVLQDRLYLARGHGDDELLFLHDVTNDCLVGASSENTRILQGRIVLEQGSGPQDPSPTLAPGPFPPLIDFSAYDNDLLDADPHQERLTLEDVPQIAEPSAPLDKSP